MLYIIIREKKVTFETWYYVHTEGCKGIWIELTTNRDIVEEIDKKNCLTNKSVLSLDAEIYYRTSFGKRGGWGKNHWGRPRFPYLRLLS